MTDPTSIRREPPPFRRCTVARVSDRTPRLRRVTLSGPELHGLDIGDPGASLRLLLPRPGETEPEVPTWTGNEFLAADGSRPAIRTLTPMAFDPTTDELDVDVVRHGQGPLGTWIDTASQGDIVAVSGTGRGYTIDESAAGFLLAGDESALPAISLILPLLPPAASLTVIVEVADDRARLPLAWSRRAAEDPDLRWVLNTGDDPGARLVDEVTAWLTADRATSDLRLWVAGEAASVQRIRRFAFEELAMARSKATIRGYWKRAPRGAEAPDTAR